MSDETEVTQPEPVQNDNNTQHHHKEWDEIIRNLTPTLLSLIVTIFLFYTLNLLFTMEIRETSKELVNYFISGIIAIASNAIGFWFGSQMSKKNNQ